MSRFLANGIGPELTLPRLFKIVVSCAAGAFHDISTQLQYHTRTGLPKEMQIAKTLESAMQSVCDAASYSDMQRTDFFLRKML